MTIKRRDFIRLSAGTAAVGTAIIAGVNACAAEPKVPASPMDKLKSMTDDIVPITVQEREGRIEKAQRLMTENKIEALVLDSGTSLKYFTGITWWPSER